MYKHECFICSFSLILTWFLRNIFTRENDFLQRIWRMLFKEICPPSTDRQVRSIYFLQLIMWHHCQKFWGGGKKDNLAIWCLCLQQKMESIQSKTDGRNCSCCLPLCLVRTAAFISLPSEIFSRSEAVQMKTKQVTLKCSTFKELFPCSYCSTTVFFLLARFSDPVSL